MFELPHDFPYQPPQDYKYQVREHKCNMVSIWLQHPPKYSYTSDPVFTIWGFYNSKKQEYYEPINSKKHGDSVDIKDTTCWTSKQLNLTPLQAAFL
jgi:hypothetical protein